MQTILGKNQSHFVLPEFNLDDYTLKKAIVLKNSLDDVFPLKEIVKIREAMRIIVYPIICFAARELVGGNEAQAIPMACAVEMILLMSLTLDDLPSMDNDHLRRGLPRNYMGFNAFLSRAFEQIATKTTDVPSHLIVRAMVEFCSAVGLEGLIGGHIDGFICEGKQLKLRELEDIHIKKTSKLLEAAAVCGAIIGGGSDTEIEKVRSYARCIGLLFVVVDEIIDMTMPSEESEETACKDFASDKATYPKLMGLENAKNFAVELVAKAVDELSCFDAAKAAPAHCFIWRFILVIEKINPLMACISHSDNIYV